MGRIVLDNLKSAKCLELGKSFTAWAHVSVLKFFQKRKKIVTSVQPYEAAEMAVPEKEDVSGPSQSLCPTSHLLFHVTTRYDSCV